jgi:hypothetical protein
MKYFWTLYASLLLVVAHVSAQNAVLIGLHLNAWDDEKGMHDPSYRTFLIIFRDGKAQLAADIPDLIVPRKDGFWRVGSLHKGPPRDGGFQEFIYTAPARSVPHAIGEFHPENPDGNCPQTRQATIGFINPDITSVSYMEAPGCSLESENHHATYMLDALGKALDITSLLGPAALVAQKEADAKSKSRRDLKDCSGISALDPANWGIESANRPSKSNAASWILVSDFNAPHVCNGGDTYEVKFPLPASIAGTSYHADALASIVASSATKDLSISSHARLTPDGNFLIAFGDFEYDVPLRVFNVKQQIVDLKPVLSVSTHTNLSWGFNLVMIQWALGSHVAAWESELKALAAASLPEPIVTVGERKQ